jgi:2-oxoglutarate ferredoxin oxidoreductase subunit beta
MSYQKPPLRHPALPANALGLTRRDYEGVLSTLCAGCGHDAVSAAIVQACFELDLPPHRLAKLSGIGCSSKTPAYFLGGAHGFNSVHGRMPSVLTGACLANRELIYLGVSGDGDTASIGLGQFAHAIRRGVDMVYVVENNGVYGLTKGQFSATADRGSKGKRGLANPDTGIDLPMLAVQMGASFVARGFSGDKDQLVPLLKAALRHRGAAVLDVLSPCVTFNNHPGSTRSYDYVREHDYPLRPVADSHDPTDRVAALRMLLEHQTRGEIVTGLLFIDPDAETLHHRLDTVEPPLNALGDAELCPGAAVLEDLNAGWRAAKS